MDKKKPMDFAKKIGYPCLYILVLGFVAFLAFYKLGQAFVNPWDEAQHGVNAYELFRTGKFFETTYAYQTDYYNLKPPMSAWVTAVIFRVIGPSVFSLRFASAFAYVILVALVGFFAKRYGKLESLMAMLFLSLNTVAFEYHMIRSGDADSLYVLFFTIAMLCMMSISKDHRYLYGCSLFFAFAFLTKSFHAGVIVIIGGLYLILTKEIVKIKWIEWIKFCLSFMIPLMIWGVGRFFVDRFVFFREMYEVDVKGRSGEGFGSHEGGFLYYFQYFFGEMPEKNGQIFIYSIALVIIIMGILLYSHVLKKENYTKIIGYVLWFLVPMLAFSAIKTKLVWYAYPSMIPILMCAGIILAKIIQSKKIHLLARGMVAVLSIVIVLHYGNQIFEKIDQQKGNEFQMFLMEAANDNPIPLGSVYLYLPGDDILDLKGYQVNWSKQDRFICEAYGDYNPKDGGLEAITFQEQYVYMVVDARLLEQSPSFITNYEVLFEKTYEKKYLLIKIRTNQ